LFLRKLALVPGLIKEFVSEARFWRAFEKTDTVVYDFFSDFVSVSHKGKDLFLSSRAFLDRSGVHFLIEISHPVEVICTCFILKKKIQVQSWEKSLSKQELDDLVERAKILVCIPSVLDELFDRFGAK